MIFVFFFFKQKTAYEMRISDWSSDVCSSDLLPMAVLAFIHIVDIEDGFWGGGSKLVVLVAATWQALWLAAAATRRLAQLRIERDHARDAEAEAQRLARRDPLTGLPNRRGFIDRVPPPRDRARADNPPAAPLPADLARNKDEQ